MPPTVEALPVSLRNVFVRAMDSGVTGVNIVATDGPGGRAGATVHTLNALSADPPQLMFSLGSDHPLLGVIEQNGGFSLNMLSEIQQPLARQFTQPQTRGEGFTATHWRRGGQGHPLLIGAIASFDCRLARRVELSGHLLIIGEVKAVQRHPGVPLALQGRQFMLIQRDQPG